MKLKPCRVLIWINTSKVGSPSGDADYFPGSPVPKNNFEITDLIRFAHTNPASLRTQENNFGSKYVKNISRLFCKRPATGK